MGVFFMIERFIIKDGEVIDLANGTVVPQKVIDEYLECYDFDRNSLLKMLNEEYARLEKYKREQFYGLKNKEKWENRVR